MWAIKKPEIISKMASKQFKDTFHRGIVKMGTEGAIEPTFFEHNFIYTVSENEYGTFTK